MVLIGMLWIPVIQGTKGLYDYLQGVQGYLARRFSSCSSSACS